MRQGRFTHLASEPENESVKQSQLLSDALMSLREPTVKLATIDCMHYDIIHRTPPEANICSLPEQCLCHEQRWRAVKVFRSLSQPFRDLPRTILMLYSVV